MKKGGKKLKAMGGRSFKICFALNSGHVSTIRMACREKSTMENGGMKGLTLRYSKSQDH